MSRHGEVTLDWGDGEYTFRVAYGELMKIQEACDAGPELVARRLRHGGWYIQDIRETIRIALIGGGKTQSEALSLVRKYVEEVPYEENIFLAFALIETGLKGALDEQLGKALGVVQTKPKANVSRKAKSPSRASSELPV